MYGLAIRPVLFLVFVAVLAPTSASPVEELDKRHTIRSSDCTVSGGIYRHGEVFSIPGFTKCIKYRCNNGVYSIVEEACENRGRCHLVGTYFEDKCLTYKCTKSHSNGYTTYKTINTQTRCEDDRGICYISGSEFAHVINGRLYRRCTCKVLSAGHVAYNCREN